MSSWHLLKAPAPYCSMHRLLITCVRTRVIMQIMMPRSKIVFVEAWALSSKNVWTLSRQVHSANWLTWPWLRRIVLRHIVPKRSEGSPLDPRAFNLRSISWFRMHHPECHSEMLWLAD
jgi:hypothetical protein